MFGLKKRMSSHESSPNGSLSGKQPFQREIPRMYVEERTDDEGILYGFDVACWHFPEKKVLKILSSSSAVSNIRKGTENYVRFHFDYCGAEFVVVQLFDDNTVF